MPRFSSAVRVISSRFLQFNSRSANSARTLESGELAALGASHVSMIFAMPSVSIVWSLPTKQELT
jgi:hypothetical protein